jgi:hypothetical protein
MDVKMKIKSISVLLLLGLFTCSLVLFQFAAGGILFSEVCFWLYIFDKLFGFSLGALFNQLESRLHVVVFTKIYVWCHQRTVAIWKFCDVYLQYFLYVWYWYHHTIPLVLPPYHTTLAWKK